MDTELNTVTTLVCVKQVVLWTYRACALSSIKALHEFDTFEIKCKIVETSTLVLNEQAAQGLGLQVA
jgi:hypothetical protein